MSEATHPIVFISYRWDGASEHAEALARTVRRHHETLALFRDKESIAPGDSWSAVLAEGIERASALVVLIDADWLHHDDDFGRRRIDLSADWVRLEIERSLGRDIPVFPALIDDARMPPATALPDTLKPLATATSEPFRLRRDHLDADCELLVRQIEARLLGLGTAPSFVAEAPTQILQAEISNFRCFEHIELDFSLPSTLAGEWTCVAGINGSGKSTLLQALALLLMGPRHAQELGGKRLAAMRRQTANGDVRNATLRAKVRHLGEEFRLETVLTADGLDSSSRESPFWKHVSDLLIKGYGPGRNLSETPDRYEDLSAIVQSHISLFDPMARMREAGVLLRDRDWQAKGIFRRVIQEVFGEEFDVEVLDSSVLFKLDGSPLRALELPDGFRSSVAWIADLCVAYGALGGSPDTVGNMSGIVLMDEIDLHLHASLQRAIVPRLRRVFPRLQFVVTSHSPLILSSFDRAELVALDRDAEGGIRSIDRQVLGFTADQIYEWLLGTRPSSEAMQNEVESAATPGRRRELAELLETSPKVNPAEAKERVAQLRDRIRSLHR